LVHSSKQKQIMEKIDTHLRKTARRMVHFDTLDETLHYLIDSFYEQYSCDYMAILYLENHRLVMKAKKGEAPQFELGFPLDMNVCLPRILVEPLCSFDVIKGKEICPFLAGLEQEQFQTWFTIPIRHEDGSSVGLGVIGFRSFVPLVIGAEKLFEEYGKNIAASLIVAQQRESEKKKIEGLEWLRENVYLGGSSLEQIVESITERAGKGTKAKAAFVYLYDESANSLLLQRPSYGDIRERERIDLQEIYDLKRFFPYLEKTGGEEITIPLTVNLKLIGVLHVIGKQRGLFTAEDLDLLQFLSSHVSALIENARLYTSEIERKTRLEVYMHHQQELVKQTIEDEGFAGIAGYLSKMLNCSVLVFDRFFHLIAKAVPDHEQPLLDAVLPAVRAEKKNIAKNPPSEQWISDHEGREMGIWKVTSGGDLLGYLGVLKRKKELDIVVRMSLNHALNVCAVQFIKQKRVLDALEQARDGFFSQLFAEKMKDTQKIMEYANLLNWNISEPHSIGLISISIASAKEQPVNLLEEDAKKTRIWDRIRDHLTRTCPGMIYTRKDGYYMVIVPQEIAVGDFWSKFYGRVSKLIREEDERVSVYMGISKEARSLEEYSLRYKQAQQTLTIVCHRFPQRGYMHFEELGAYTVLYHLGDPLVVPLFLKTYLSPLLHHGKGKNRDLFDTLRVYLQTNGNIKEAAQQLFIHRSSLKYRLERIRDLLNIDIDHAEQRFNLMMAYKLHDLFGDETIAL